jgi:methionyl-tRNA synthetase
MTERYFDGLVPEKDFEFSDELAGIWRQYREALDSFQIDKAIDVIKKLNTFADGYIERNKPWELAKTNEDQLKKVLYNLLEAIRHLAIMISPIMPDTANEIMDNLGQIDWQKKKFKELIDWGGLEPNTKVKKGDPLFPRIEKE